MYNTNMCGKAALDFEKYSLHHFESHNFGAFKHSLWIFFSRSSALYNLKIYEIIPCKILSYIFCSVFFVCLLCFRYSNCLYQPPHFPCIILVFCCSLFRLSVPLVLRLYSLTRKDWLYVLLGRFLRVTSVRLCAALVSVFSFPLAHRLNTSSRTECSTNLYIVCIIPPNHSNRYSQLKLNCVHPYQVLDTINLIVET